MLVELMTAKFSSTLVKGAADFAIALMLDFLARDSDVAQVVTRLATSNPNAARVLVRWLAAKRGIPFTLPPALAAITVSQAEEVAGAVEAAARGGRSEPGQLLITSDAGLALSPPEERVGFGLTRHGGEFRPLLLLAAEQLAPVELRDSQFETRIVGFASVENPPAAASAEDAAVYKNMPHRPGRSVAHNQGMAGSLGLYVSYAEGLTGRHRKVGFLSASHVLGNINRAVPDDIILSPGPPPDEFLDGMYLYGRYQRGKILRHFNDQSERNLAVNLCDIALASVVDLGLGYRNEVPDPNDPGKRWLPIADVVPLENVRDFTEGDVFLVGRSTPFAQGRLIGTSIREFPIRMPNWRNYMFGDLCLVERQGPNPFSRPGDSGALVYVLEGNQCRALGFVVGGNERYTFVTPADTCLTAMNVRLYERRPWD